MIPCSSLAMPTARVGAPPARLKMVFSPISLAVCVSWSGVITKPHWLIAVAALFTSTPISAAGEFMEKYTPGCSALAAMIAMIATKASVSMPP